MITYKLILLIIFISCVETFGQFLVRKHHEKNHNIYYLLAAWLVYLGVIKILEKAYHYSGMGLANALWSGLTIILVSLVGKYYFGETVRPGEWVGMFIIIAGMCVAGYCSG